MKDCGLLVSFSCTKKKVGMAVAPARLQHSFVICQAHLGKGHVTSRVKKKLLGPCQSRMHCYYEANRLQKLINMLNCHNLFGDKQNSPAVSVILSRLSLVPSECLPSSLTLQPVEHIEFSHLFPKSFIHHDHIQLFYMFVSCIQLPKAEEIHYFCELGLLIGIIKHVRSKHMYVASCIWCKWAVCKQGSQKGKANRDSTATQLRINQVVFCHN